MKGLTWDFQRVRGLLGRSPRFDVCKNGKDRVKFDLGIGINDPENLKFMIWRHCILTGETVSELRKATKGDLVLVEGWSVNEALKDEHGLVLRKDNGMTETKENLICFSALMIPKEEWKKDDIQLPLGVEKAFSNAEKKGGDSD